MKGLAVDLSVSELTVSAKNEDLSVSAQFNIGMRQSETLLPAIEYVMERVGIKKDDLDYLAIAKGPGSFTGLRLSFAALKAIQLAAGIPLYGISSLDIYAWQYRELPYVIVPAIDARKDKFYAKALTNGTEALAEGDYEPSALAEKLRTLTGDILLCGPDASLLKHQLPPLMSGRTVLSIDFHQNPAKALFEIAEGMISAQKPPLNEYDGPEYIRASEAEEKLRS